VKKGDYLPNEQSFSSGLPEGKSTLNPKSSNGRTRRERDKNNRRFERIRARSNADLQAQGKPGGK
jgi:hypothetical protein